MRLYQTANGKWCCTQGEARTTTKAEGSKPGSWRERDVPTAKARLIAFLNHTGAAPAPAARPAAPTPPTEPGGSRWRIYVKGQFACSLAAPDKAAALNSARAMMDARPDNSR